MVVVVVGGGGALAGRESLVVAVSRVAVASAAAGVVLFGRRLPLMRLGQHHRMRKRPFPMVFARAMG